MDVQGQGLVVLGPNRSGTSAVAAALRALGVWFGPASELPAGGWYIDYEPGENARIVGLNSDLANHFETGAVPFRGLPESWGSFADADDLVDGATRLHTELFGGHSTWGWKDPRGSLLIPFYERVFSGLGTKAEYLLPIRHPYEVAKGVFERQLLPIPEGIGYWVNYTLHVLTQPEPDRLLPFLFDRFVQDPRAVLAPIWGRLGLPAPTEDEWRRVSDAVRPGLHRSRHTDEALPELAQRVWEFAQTIALAGELRKGSPAHAEVLRLFDEWQALTHFTRMPATYATLVRWRSSDRQDRKIFRGERIWHSYLIEAPPGSLVELQFTPVNTVQYIRNARFVFADGAIPAVLESRDGAFMDAGGPGEYRLLPFSEQAHAAFRIPAGPYAARFEFDFQFAAGPAALAQITNRLRSSLEASRRA